jgi:serine protease
LRSFASVILLMAAAVAVAASALDAERNPVRRRPVAGAHGAPSQAIIVKLRVATSSGQTPTPRIQDRLGALAARAGLSLTGYRPITEQLQVIRVENPAAGESLAGTLARLRADPQVQYAEPDQRRYIHGVPNDPLYPDQWYLLPSSATTPSAIDAQTAWNTSTGAAGLVIADIDTGVRFEHPDLLSVSQSGGRLLSGYCFISDPFIANNASCPGADASDPGDWVTSSDLTQPECSNASVAYSSWHGTRVAGILGAIANNAAGIAGVTWTAQILPVRALGKCGGTDSDIISGMLWAAGIAVSGAPVNTHPAKIINMSLGGTGSCPLSYQDVVNQITALGVLIVASAGNEGGPVDAPANCSGVVAVAGLRHAGTKVGYSSLGPEVALGAPAGNCVNTTASAPCVYELITTTNLGTQGPDADDYTGMYSCDPTTGGNANCSISGNQYRTPNLGTSFSAPQVAAIGALMTTVNSKLNSCQLLSRLQEGALPYPQSSVGETPQPPLCHVPASSADVQSAECICTTDGQTCGAGMASAPGALNAAQRPIAAVSVPASVTAGQAVALTGTGSAAQASHTITTYAWANAGGETLSLQNANTASASVTLPKCGVSTVTLTVTDDAGRQDTGAVSISPTAVTTTAPATAGQTACSSVTPAVQVGVCPASVSLQVNGGTQAFTSTLINTTNANVTWQVNGIDGGNTSVGTISSTGVYSAPASVPAGGTVTVTALSVADSSASASSQIALTAPPGSGGGGGGGGELDWLTLLAVGVSAVAARRAALAAQLRHTS